MSAAAKLAEHLNTCVICKAASLLPTVALEKRRCWTGKQLVREAQQCLRCDSTGILVDDVCYDCSIPCVECQDNPASPSFSGICPDCRKIWHTDPPLTCGYFFAKYKSEDDWLDCSPEVVYIYFDGHHCVFRPGKAGRYKLSDFTHWSELT